MDTLEGALKRLRLTTPAPGIYALELDHGKANEMGTAELDDLDTLTHLLAADLGARALVTFSRRRSRSGTPLFIAGANVTERVGWSDDQIKAHVRRQRQLLVRLREAPVFHVAVVGGVALGWGTELLLAADYVIAADGARFALPETGLGIVPGAGGTSELQRRVGPAHALRLTMTGEAIDAAEAVRIGLAQEHVPSLEDAIARGLDLAGKAATRSPTANAAAKAALLASQGQGALARQELEARAYEHSVDAGDAAAGRAWFADGAQGSPIWAPRRPWHP